MNVIVGTFIVFWNQIEDKRWNNIWSDCVCWLNFVRYG